MKKKVISLILICTILCVPIKYSRAITFPINDNVDDVKFHPNENEDGVPYYYPPVDIYKITTNDSHLQYIFVEKPIVDNKHQYKIKINWDDSINTNYTIFIAGNLVENAVDKNDNPTTLVNGSHTIIKDSGGTQIYSDVNNNTAIVEGCDSIVCLMNFSAFSTLPISNPYQVEAFAKVPEDQAIYPLLDVGLGIELKTTHDNGWICDTAGSGTCWPQENGWGLREWLLYIGTPSISIVVIAIIIIIMRRKK